MDCLDFRIRIRGTCSSRTEVTVEQSPVGGAILEDWRPRLSPEVRRLVGQISRGPEDTRELDEDQGGAPGAELQRRGERKEALRRELGVMLFELLFTGPLRSCLDRSLDALHIQRTLDRGATALRLRLIFGAPGDPASLNSVAHLAALPWELLYHPNRGRFLALEEDTPIVRTVDVQSYRPPLEVDPPLQVLLVESSPRDAPSLELDREIEKLCDQLTDTSLIRLRLLEHATFEALHNELQTEPVHVLHFLGHGNSSGFFLEDLAGTSDLVSAQRLAALTGRVRSLRLAVINACESAGSSERVPGDTFRGVAAALFAAGVPVVVGMQVAIGDRPAIDFSDAFYRTLATNEPIEVAATRGRQAICENARRRADEALAVPKRPDYGAWGRAQTEALEWSTPVLYSSTETGRLFDILPVVDLFGIRFRQVAGILLAERPLTEADWYRIDGAPSVPPLKTAPLTGEEITIAAIEALFLRSKERAQKADERVARLRLPTEAELRLAYASGARGLRDGSTPFHYCTREDRTHPYGAVKGDSPNDVVSFQHTGRNATYSPHCVVRPVLELRSAAPISRVRSSEGANSSKGGRISSQCDSSPPPRRQLGGADPREIP